MRDRLGLYKYIFLGPLFSLCLVSCALLGRDLVSDASNVVMGCKERFLDGQLKVGLIESGDEVMCVYGEQGGFCCWDDNGEYEAELNDVSIFAVAFRYVCSILRDGQVACLNYHNQNDGWIYYGEFRYLASSGHKIYGVSEESKIYELIGPGYRSLPFVYFNNVYVNEIAYFDAAMGWPCWITADNEFGCGTTVEQKITEYVSSLSCGYDGCCYVVNGAIVSCPMFCSSCGERLERLIDQVEVSYFAYCVLTDVGRIYCSNVEREEYFWSSNDAGYVDLAMRMNELCAVSANGQLRCWDLF